MTHIRTYKSLKEESREKVNNGVVSVIGATAVGYFDGLCEPRNPGGYACGGWYVEEMGDRGSIAGHCCYLSGPGATNNVAEYEAALDCLRSIYATGWRGPVLLRGDSKLVVCQVAGEWACNAEHLRVLRDKLREATAFFERVDFEWVPREENETADMQSRMAYKRETGLAPPARRNR